MNNRHARTLHKLQSRFVWFDPSSCHFTAKDRLHFTLQRHAHLRALSWSNTGDPVFMLYRIFGKNSVRNATIHNDVCVSLGKSDFSFKLDFDKNFRL
jgi:hypothetical protein